jgi:hypothetical protein
MLFSAKYSSFANTWFWEIYTHMRFPCGSASLIAADRAEGAIGVDVGIEF